MKIIWYIWFLKYKVQKTEIFVILDQFLSPYWAFYPPMDSYFFILHRHTINDNHITYDSWDMECDRQNFLSFWIIFCSFTPLTQKIKILKKWKKPWRYYHFTHMYHRQSYDVWFLRYEARRTEFFVILDCLLPFYPPPNNPKNRNFEKLKKLPEDIIILHKFTKNHDHMLYYSLDMARNRCNCYFSFWAIFCPFTSLTAQKIKIYKK